MSLQNLSTSTIAHFFPKKTSSFSYCLLILGTGVLLSELSEDNSSSKDEKSNSLSVPLIAYLSTHYPDERLSKEVIEQLLWFQESMITTSKSSVRLSDKKENLLHIEIKRALWLAYIAIIYY